ncbi:MAG: viperin family antiviral radical SAM protein [Campylobacteraceae bacterium]|jgi:radical S-adenosyl methionine domain-containing protein 2|nr:viperin family antiviral radical SAM protein [Campylobacteraceae bacterium]
MGEIVINWHITQKCNYKCYYCFAKYENEISNEVCCSKSDTELLLKRVFTFFVDKYKTQNIRLNIVGGEPTLSKNIDFIIQKAYHIGFRVSIITNGSKISKSFLETNTRFISLFAFSIDSIDSETNKLIGRSQNNRTIKDWEILNLIENIRSLNKHVNIKINTVVNKNNYREYMGDFINTIHPNKWKIFQALPINSDEIYCTNEQFNIFLKNHKNTIITPYKEHNEDMINSYIMIDPYGRFYQNTHYIHSYSKSILEIPIKKAFDSISFNIDKFKKRYINEKN